MPEITHYCIHEKEWGELTTTLKNIENSFARHVNEAESPGGWRDRLILTEQNAENLKKEISTIKQGYWKACVVSGLIGGMLGKITPDVLSFLVKTALAYGQ